MRWHYGLWALVAARLVCWHPLPMFGDPASALIPGYSFDLVAPLTTLPGLLQNPVQPDSLTIGAHYLPISLFATIWLAGALLVGGSLLLSHFAFLRKLSREEKHQLPSARSLLAECATVTRSNRQVTVLASVGVNTPVLFGVLQPTILVPSSTWFQLQPNEQKFILAHELVHVSRLDLFTNWLALLVQSVYWFNPLVWYACYCFRQDREMACDEQVLNNMDSSQRLQYADTILRLVERMPRHRLLLGAAGFVGSSFVQRRIKMIAEYRKHSKRITAILVALLVVLGAVAFVSAAGAGLPPAARWLCTADKVLRQADGQGWQDVTPAGISNLNGWRNFFLDGDHGWLLTGMEGTTGTVYHTNDGGKSWLNSSLPEGISNGSLFFIDVNTGWILAGLDAGMMHEPVAVLRTSDGGMTWAEVNRTTNDSVGQIPSSGIKSGISFVTAQRGFVTGYIPAEGQPYCYRTDDGGVTWQGQTLPLGETYAHNQLSTYPPVFFDNGQGVLPVTAFNDEQAMFFYLTGDGGLNWVAGASITHSSDLPGFVWSFPDVQHGFMTDGQSFYTSNDGGLSWELSPTNLRLQQPEKLVFVSSQIGFALGEKALQTTDGGQTWNELGK